MSVTLTKPYAELTTGTHVCDDTHGMWYILQDVRVPARATVRELLDSGYSARVLTMDVRGFEPLTPTDLGYWHDAVAITAREEREERYAER